MNNTPVSKCFADVCNPEYFRLATRDYFSCVMYRDADNGTNRLDHHIHEWILSSDDPVRYTLPSNDIYKIGSGTKKYNRRGRAVLTNIIQDIIIIFRCQMEQCECDRVRRVLDFVD